MGLKITAVLLTVAGLSAPACATNGMDLEGYGPVAAAMGGASFAYDNGAGAMMNNPATLGLMGQGSGIGVALGFLGPNVNASFVKSGGDAYYMPAIGYVTKTGNLTYGIGMYSQGGMGTEYGASSPMAYGTGDKVRSEVGVGRLILPLAYNMNNNLTIGGSLDWVWATMDMKMAATTPQFMSMATGNMSSGFGGMLMNPATGLISHFGADTFRIDFSDNNKFSGKAIGSGFAGKLGIVYEVGPTLTVGATYHTKTNLGDMKTDANGASFSAFKSGGSLGPAMTGKITIRDFQWPETFGFGLAYRANERWLIAADYKRINWSGVMQNFKMTFSTSSEFADFKISQNWADQNVFMIGASYRMNEAVTLRFGGNFSNNPVPDNRVNPLFPAIVKDQYTVGFGYLLSRRSGLDFSLSYAPKVTGTGTQTTDVPYSGAPDNATTITHSQLNWQLQYGYHF